VELEAANRKWEGEESHPRKQAELEIEGRKQAWNEAADTRRQAEEEEEEAKSQKMAEEEAAYLQQQQKTELEANP